MDFLRIFGPWGGRMGRHGLVAFFLTAALASGWAQTGLTLRGDVVEGAVGEDVRVVFRTEGFWQITEGMGTLQWDSEVMDYVTAGDFGIPVLNNGSFSRIPEGILIFDWSADNLLGNTLPDGTILFSLTFDLRGAAGDSTTVAFTNGWTTLHFESAENINLPFSSVPASVSIVPEPAPAFLTLAGGLLMTMLGRGRRPRH